MPDARAVILNHGDVLEQRMFADDEFAASFALYVVVWNAVVLPNRDPSYPTLAIEPWRGFGGHHYSAIVRCWNAYRAKKRFAEQCVQAAAGDDKAGALLDLHEHYVAFFCSIGGAYDNLSSTFSTQQVNAPLAFADAVGSATKPGTLKWFYERRTQAVHKLVIPCFLKNGVPCFDRSAFSDPDVKWDQLTNDIHEFDEAIEQLWLQLIGEFKRCWSRLLDVLKAKQSHLFTSTGPIKIVSISEGQSSASPNDPRFTIPPSGCKLREDGHGVSGYDPNEESL